jgi:glycosyltransferase involved in cell wall biosynthesis
MRIVHVAPFYHPVIGGVEEAVKRIAEYTLLKGYEVFVVTYNRFRHGGVYILPQYEVINGVNVVRVKPDFIFSYGTYSSEVSDVLRELKPDIVHVHVWRHPHVFQVAKLKRTIGFKIILHGHAPFHGFNQLSLVTWLYHRSIDIFGHDYLKSYDKYIALTPYEVEKVISMGLRRDRVTILPNGINEDTCRIDNTERDERQILYLGRISKAKNLDILVKAMTYVSKEIRNAEIVLAGPDEGVVKNLIEYARRNSVNIKYLGTLAEAEKHKLYLQSYVYSLPSLYEPFGITLLEAAQHGLPLTITGYGGQQYVAPPNIISLWEKPTPEDFSQAILTLLTNKNLWRKLSQNAIRYAKNFLWSKILSKYERLYNEISVKGR